MFKRNKIKTIDVININAKNIMPGQMRTYMSKLRYEKGFDGVGFRFELKKNIARYVIFTVVGRPNTREVIQYFKDRCPAMVENECIQLKPSPVGEEKHIP